ncbi:MAG: hypothetical protein RBJ76_03750 [Stenomitos frigidus ULC029]
MSTYPILSKHLTAEGASLESFNTHFDRTHPSSTQLVWSEPIVLEPTDTNGSDLVCFSHLRWDFVYQRPQHLLSRCATNRRVFIIEEPIVSPDDSYYLAISKRECGVWIAVPHLPEGLSEERAIVLQQLLLDRLMTEAQIQAPILWYYNPMSVSFTSHIEASAVIYDCMDELSA